MTNLLNLLQIKYETTFMPVVFLRYFGTGAGALRIGKISDKTRILGNFSFQLTIHLDWKEVF